MPEAAPGLAAIPRDTLEAARTDGASEWQVFRRVTVPMLAPVLSVVFITMLINVLKVFDIIMQERSLTRCAERMGKSVTATSQALRRLRHELGDELFESPGRGMVPQLRARLAGRH